MSVDLHELEAFSAVARHRSFRKAAQERGVSASALSHAMRSLESRLGLRLLNRSTRSVTPTQAGQRLLERLDPALQTVTEALQELAMLRQEPAGRLRLSVPRPAAQLFLGRLLADFVARYPKVDVEVVSDDGLTDIVAQGFDAGIRYDESLAGDMIAVPIGPLLDFAVVASPDYLARHGIPHSPRDLPGHACIGRRFPSGVRWAWEFQDHGRPLRVAISGPLVFDDDGPMIDAALAGAGVACVYTAMVKPALDDGRLQRLLQVHAPPAGRFHLYCAGRHQRPPALQALLDFVRA